VTELSLSLQQAEAESKRKQSALDQAIADQNALSNQRQEQEKLTAESAARWGETMSGSIFNSVDEFLRVRLDEAQQDTIKREIDAYHWAIKNLEGAIKQLKTELEGKQRIDLQTLEQKLKVQQQIANDADIVWRNLDARTRQLISVKEKLIKAHTANASLHKQYSIYGTLNDVANGATGNKVSLQRFVLSVLLDDVLIQASHRLHIMSKGRYQLIRKEDRAKGNKASGLELEVEDGDTGKPRAVATLSGGESFMAALSLALGLSDVVQSYAGGIKLDTLFIDEGFGSLDIDSLDAAIRVLMDLQASGRMIGIISHVSELKEQMANRIDVLISKTGSSIKTVAA
jgi:exonuclease SbcC